MKRLQLLTLVGLAIALLVPVTYLAQQASLGSQHQSLIDLHGVADGEIITVAGGADIAPGMAPRKVALLAMSGVAVDPQTGWVYVSDAHRHQIFKINPEGTKIYPFAGTGIGGFNGDGNAADKTMFHVPGDIAVHPETGDVYLADTHNYRVRVIKADGSKVTTVAGRGIQGIPDEDIPTEFPLVGPHGRRTEVIFSGDGGPATGAELNQPMSVALDRAGNLYIADTANHRLRVVNMNTETFEVAGVEVAPGNIKTLAGTGEIGFSGDGGPALAAEMDTPRRVRVARNGDILFVDMLNNRVRLIDAETGSIVTVEQGTAIKADQSWDQAFNVDWSLDGLALADGPGLATAAGGAAASDGYGVLYSDIKLHAVFKSPMNEEAVSLAFRKATRPKMEQDTETSGADWLRTRRTVSGPRTLIAGTGAQGRSPDGVAANRASMFGPGSVAVGIRGEVYFVDIFNQLLWKVEDGGMTIFAGSGSEGDGIAATDAIVGNLASIEVDSNGDIYFPDMFLHKIRHIDASSGTISRYAGKVLGGYSGDGGPPGEAQLLSPLMLSVYDNEMFISDPAIPVLRRIVRGPEEDRIETYAGVPFSAGNFEIVDGVPANQAQLGMPQEAKRHPITGELYFSDSVLNVIRKIDNQGVITTIGGIGPPWNQGYGGDDGPALSAQFNWPSALLFDAEGNLYVTDVFNHRIRKIGADGTVSTFAGLGVKGYGGDDGPALEAKLDNPVGLAWDKNGNMVIADSGNHRIRMIEMRPPYQISTIVGTGKRGFAGDGGPAAGAQLNQPRGVAVGPDNTLYITDSLNQRIRAVRFPVESQ